MDDIEAMLDNARTERKQQKRTRSASVESNSSYGSSFASRGSSPDPAASKWLQTFEDQPKQSQPGSSKDQQQNEGGGVDSELKADNVGAKLLAKMGWKAGQGLGAQGQGRVDPIRAADQIGFTGLGKTELDADMLTGATFKPRELESQTISKESKEQRTKREEALAKKQQVKDQVAETLEKFFCDICNKGYKNVSQWEEHIRSYAHNHAKRKVELVQQQKAAKAQSGELDARRERERKREEREMRKMGISAGLTSHKPAGAHTSAAPAKEPGAAKAGGFKKVGASSSSSSGGGGWAKVGAPSNSSSAAAAAAAPPSNSSAPPPPPPIGGPSAPPPPPPVGGSAAPPPPSPPPSSSSAPTFKPAVQKPASNTFVPPASVPKPQEWKPAGAAPIHPMLVDQQQTQQGGHTAKPSGFTPAQGSASRGARPTAGQLMGDDEDEQAPQQSQAGSSRPGLSGGFKMAFNRK